MSERDEIDKLLRLIDARLDEVMSPVRRAAAAAVNRAKDGTGTIPSYRLPFLQNLTANLFADVFGASPGDQFDADGIARTPMARIISDGVRAASIGPVGDYVAQVKNIEATNVRKALLRGRPSSEPQRLVDPARKWVDPNGYTLSDRIWQSGEKTRASIDTLLEFHVGQGTDAATIGKELESFLTIDGATKPVRVKQPDGSYKIERVPRTTRTPYGTKGLHVPRTLARTEVARAQGVATIEVAAKNPFVRGVGWRLSGSHPDADSCDENAKADKYKLGAGNYPPDKVPTFPDHPNCLCYLDQVLIDNPQRVVEDLGKWVRGEDLPEFDGIGDLPADAETMISWLTDINTRPNAQPKALPKAQPIGPPKRFKSTAAAEKWAEARYPQTAFDFEGLDIDLVNDVTQRIYEEFEAWPAPARLIKYVGTYRRKLPKGVRDWSSELPSAIAHAHWDGAAIALNPVYYGSKQKLEGAKKAGVFRGFFTPAGGDPCATFVHEFGHIIDSYYRDFAGDVAVLPNVRLDGTGLAGHIWSTFKANNKATKSTSMYATTNAQESIAEGYTYLRLVKSVPRAKWPAYVKRLDEMLKTLRAAEHLPKGAYSYLSDLPRNSPEWEKARDEIAAWYRDLAKRANLPQ